MTPPSPAAQKALSLYRAVCLTTAGRVIIALLLLAVVRLELFAGQGLSRFFTSTQIAYHIDLDVYWKGGATILDGGDLYNTSLPVGGITLPFTYPPISALLFGILTWIPLDVAAVINYFLTVAVTYWLLVQVFTILLGRTAVGCAVSAAASAAGGSAISAGAAGNNAGGTTGTAAPSRSLDNEAAVYRTTFAELNPTLLAFAALPIALLIEPVCSTLSFGQINIYLMALVALDLLLPRTRWPRGLWVGLAAAVKLTPAVFGLYFLIRKQWTAALTCVASALVWTGLAWVIRPSDSREYWFVTLHDPSRIGGLAYSGNQSLRGMIARFTADTHLQAQVWVAVSVVAFIIAAAAMWRLERLREATAWGVQVRGAAGETTAAAGAARGGSVAGPSSSVITLVQASVNSLVALLISPVSWSHHWVWFLAIIPVCIAAAVRTRHWVPTSLAIAGSLFVTVLQFHWFFPHSDNKELQWNLLQKILGSDFVVYGVFFLIAVLWIPRVFVRTPTAARA